MNTTGFPSPAQGYEDSSLDFNSLIIERPATTFTLRYSGGDIPEYSLKNGDLLVVDCSLKPERDSLVIVRTMDGFLCHQITDMVSVTQNGDAQNVFVKSTVAQNADTHFHSSSNFSNYSSHNTTQIPAYTDESGRICLCREVFGTVRAIIRIL